LTFDRKTKQVNEANHTKVINSVERYVKKHDSEVAKKMRGMCTENLEATLTAHTKPPEVRRAEDLAAKLRQNSRG